MKPVFFCLKTDGGAWIRIFGYGFYFKNLKKSPLLFSEIYAYRKGIIIKHWYIGWLGGWKT